MSLDDPSDSDSVRHVRTGTKFKRTRIDDTQSKSTQTKRRESTWKVDGQSTGVFSKLKLLEHELLNLEKVMKDELSKVPLLMRKQAKRHQALAGKMNDLCKRMIGCRMWIRRCNNQTPENVGRIHLFILLDNVHYTCS